MLTFDNLVEFDDLKLPDNLQMHAKNAACTYSHSGSIAKNKNKMFNVEL